MNTDEPVPTPMVHDNIALHRLQILWLLEKSAVTGLGPWEARHLFQQTSRWTQWLDILASRSVKR